jgi:dual specificity phosphatase 12
VIDVLDMPYINLMCHFGEAIAYIKEGIAKGGGVFVHCYAGISRSSSCVIAYLMSEHKMSFYEAMSYVRKKRPIIYPNIGF